MEQSGWMMAVLVVCFLFAVSSGGEWARKHLSARIKSNIADDSPIYNGTLARILVHYDAAVYESDLTELFSWTCTKCNGPTKGFEVTELIVDIQHCLQSYVGVSKDLNAIIIAFRGTQENSIQNWVEDLFWKQLDLNYPGMPDAAMVHHGFYNAYHNTTVRHGVINAVKRTEKLYGDLDIIVIGHSMGGAMAAFCALDLKVWLNSAESENSAEDCEKICDESGEDASCSRSVMGNSIADHLCYFGVNLQAESWNSCKIVTDPRLAKYSTIDNAGNIILKKPSSSILKMKTETDTIADNE
ncbi:hypothetical protein V2J09_015844 [Rumex salicifolius]